VNLSHYSTIKYLSLELNELLSLVTDQVDDPEVQAHLTLAVEYAQKSYQSKHNHLNEDEVTYAFKAFKRVEALFLLKKDTSQDFAIL
jgi:hypothetical protein